MSSISEPNTLLEINDAHVDNYMLVFPRLPSSKYLSSVFNDLTKHTNTVSASGTTNDCPPPKDNQVQRESNLDLANFKLFISGVTLPSITNEAYDLGTQFSTLKRSGKTTYSEFTTSMQVSENFLNYNIVLYWMYMLHNPEEYNKTSGRELIDSIFTDVYLIITNNHREKIAEYKFLDTFPISLPSIQFTPKSADKISVDVTWGHSGMFPSNSFVLKWV
jgi:hypothetical protein